MIYIYFYILLSRELCSLLLPSVIPLRRKNFLDSSFFANFGKHLQLKMKMKFHLLFWIYTNNKRNIGVTSVDYFSDLAKAITCIRKFRQTSAYTAKI